MNEQPQQALSGLIDKSLNGIDAATIFLQAEIPDVIRQLLLWHGVYNFMLFLVGVLLIIALIYGNYKQIKWVVQKNKSGEHWDDDILALNALQLALIIPVSFAFNLEWLQIWMAPKAWLIEYVAKLAQ